jgi:hypothetical protein
MEDLKLGAGAAIVGWAEQRSKADANFLLNKVPMFVDQLGWTGNLTLAAHLVNKFFVRNKWLGYAVKAGVVITGYQLGARGAAFDHANQHFTLSGASYLGDEHYLDEHEVGALEAEAMEAGAVPYDDAVHDALAHT